MSEDINISDAEEDDRLRVSRLRLMMPLDQVLGCRVDLMNKVHKEDNIGNKLEYIADIVDVVFSLLERVSIESQERLIKLEEKLDKNRDYFAAEFKSIASRLDSISTRQNSMSTEIREEMQINHIEVREKLEALLKK